MCYAKIVVRVLTDSARPEGSNNIMYYNIHVELTTVPSVVTGLLDHHFDLDPTTFDSYMYQAKGW